VKCCNLLTKFHRMGKKSKNRQKLTKKCKVGEDAGRADASALAEPLPTNADVNFSNFMDTLRIRECADNTGSASERMAANPSGILQMLLESFIPGDGWVPRHTFDPRMTMDFHAWCVDEKGMVHDYPDNQLIRGKYWTCHVVRRPWDANLIVKALPHIEKRSKDLFFDKNTHVSLEQFLSMIEDNTFPQSHCYPRAKILRDSDPSRFALVLGSLGYRQSDGRVYWECG